MEITQSWRAAISQAKRGGGPSSSSTSTTTSTTSSSIMQATHTQQQQHHHHYAPTTAITDPFTQQAKEVLEGIKGKEELLRRSRDHYVDAYRYVPSRASDMTEQERDQIDQLMASFIIKCGSQIEIIRCALAEASSLEAGGGTAAIVGGGGSRLAHYGGLVAYLAERLQDLSLTLQSLQGQRRQLNSLVPSSASAASAASGGGGRGGGGGGLGASVSSSLIGAVGGRKRLNMPTLSSSSTPSMSGSENRRKGQPVIAQSKLEVEEDEAYSRRLAAREGGSSKQEQQQRQLMLQQENKALTLRLNNELEDVRMMEGKMVELSQLLGLFTGKLMEQQDQVDEVHEAAVGTQENVGQGNEELLKTLHRNSKASQTMLTFVITLCIAMLIFDQIIP